MIEEPQRRAVDISRKNCAGELKEQSVPTQAFNTTSPCWKIPHFKCFKSWNSGTFFIMLGPKLQSNWAMMVVYIIIKIEPLPSQLGRWSGLCLLTSPTNGNQTKKRGRQISSTVYRCSQSAAVLFYYESCFCWNGSPSYNGRAWFRSEPVVTDLVRSIYCLLICKLTGFELPCKEDRIDVSFSKVKYISMASFVGLDTGLKQSDINTFELHHSHIPTALFQSIVQDIDIMLVQYGPPIEHEMAEARSQFLFPVGASQLFIP